MWRPQCAVHWCPSSTRESFCSISEEKTAGKQGRVIFADRSGINTLKAEDNVRYNKALRVCEIFFYLWTSEAIKVLAKLHDGEIG